MRGMEHVDPHTDITTALSRGIATQLRPIIEELLGQQPRLALTVDEFAASIGISRSSAYRLVDAGLPTLRVGHCRRIEPQTALAWLREQGADVGR